MPSLIESPNATIPRASAGTIMSSASRKYQDAVLNGKAFSSSLSPLAPAPGAVKYEVVGALACQVIGPLSPTTWKLTGSLGPSNSAVAGSCTKGTVTGSLHTELPGATAVALLPAKLTGWLLQRTSAVAVRCKPTWMPSKVTGLVPSASENLSLHLTCP